ncbi:MAG: hypothetical protein LN409_05275, partial [Candidatus Thermoplasmatota archaeon]|nr:hypothetical protein [Candidatus Thermoplasmatota archaeon]
MLEDGRFRGNLSRAEAWEGAGESQEGAKSYEKTSDGDSGGCMAQLDFQPEMIGRQNELKGLHEHLSKASQGRGTTL